MEKALYLVTGAAGHLGNTVVGSLLALNQQVRALILPSERPRPSMQGAEIVEGDVCLRDSLAPFFKPVPGLPTKLIHCAGVISIGSRFFAAGKDIAGPLHVDVRGWHGRS